jgi:DHA2 family multidrug resistance protein
VCTPIVGRIYNQVSPRLLVAFGVACVGWGSLEMGRFTLQTGDVDIIKVLVLQGIGFSSLFVPLTTVALSNVPRTQIADATGLNSLVRQFGGSAGLAIYGTLLAQFEELARNALIVHVDPFRPEVAQRLDMMTRAFMARGMDAGSAHAAAVQALGGTVARQASLLAFDKVFVLTAIMMFALLPLAYFLHDRTRHLAHAPGESHPVLAGE